MSAYLVGLFGLSFPGLASGKNDARDKIVQPPNLHLGEQSFTTPYPPEEIF
jgi:hypothetical protein